MQTSKSSVEVGAPVTGAQGGVSKPELLAMSASELIALFHTLEPPSLDEMRGEYAATLLDQGSAAANLIGRAVVNAPGRWLCKAFEPRTQIEGHGYNSFARWGRVSRRFRMRTFVGPSRIDEGESYHLDYAAFNRGWMSTMYDEVRRVSDGLYLGIGRVGYGKRQQRKLLPFLLEGPTAAFIPPSEW